MTTDLPAEPLATLRDFTRNPVRAGRELRDALFGDRRAFLEAITGEPGFDVNDRGFRYAMTLLASNDVLIPVIVSSTETTLAQALSLTRSMLSLDSNFLNSLLTAILMRKDLKATGYVLRALDIVAECAAHLANWRSLAQIHLEGDVRVKLKCASLLARFRFDDESGLERFRRSDSRVRANIVQALWGEESAGASALLGVAIHDRDNRVAGNACLALYNIGDARSLSCLAAMLESTELKRQITAAWVMGQCRDERFAARLLEASRSSHAPLKKVAIASLAKIDPATKCDRGVGSGCEDVDLSFVSASEPVSASEEPELWLHVTGKEGRPLSRVRPVDFFVWSGDDVLLDYSVEEMDPADRIAVGIVYPAGREPIVNALKAGLEVKSESQLWVLAPYGGVAGNTEQAVAPHLESETEALMAQLTAESSVITDAGSALRSIAELDAQGAAQHLLFLLDGTASDADPDQIRSYCMEKKIRFHCWHFEGNSGGDGPVCPGTIRSEAEAVILLPRLIASLSHGYSLQARQRPTAVAIRNTSTKPARFSGRTNLLKDVQA